MPESTPRLAEALKDRYAIERKLGQGGMATVYLAEDLKHKRKVALKVLKPELAAVLGAERFVQEIATTAALQHPHILPLFDSGTAEGFLFYVMPFIDGETLRGKLDRETQLGVEEAVKITTEVADALDYAHQQGVIHRDIKPENILLANGRPMVADFGIALAVSAAAGGRMTETGLSLGTPHYMSPEQATAEKEISARSDIYSLGSVLYEMLTGNPPHTGASAQQIIMKIVTEDAAPVATLRKSVPANVAAAIAVAIEKLPADRFGTAAEFATALKNPAFRAAGVSMTGGPRSARALVHEPVVLALAGVAITLLIALVMLLSRDNHFQAAGVSRFAVELWGDQGGGAGTVNRRRGIAIADDGSQFAYVVTQGARTEILIRKRDQLEAEPVRSTDDVRCCLSFSPDGQSLAYITMLNGLKVVSLLGGVSRFVVESGLQETSLYGGGVDWGPDSLLYLSTVDGISRFKPEGGAREQVTTIRPDERTHAWMDVLPNGKGALLTVIPKASGDRSAYTISVADFAKREITTLFQGVYARYAVSGHVIFVQDDGTLLAAPFDQDRLAVTGATVALGEGVEVGDNGAAWMAVSQSGTLVYRRGRRVPEALRWVNRTGAMEGEEAPELDATSLEGPRLSPDGTRFAVSRTTAEGQHIWTRAVAGGEPVRHTFQGQINRRLNWSPTGDLLYYVSDSEDAGSVFVMPVDGTGTPRRVALPETRPIFDVAPVDDSTLVIRTDNQAPGNGDILLAHLSADTTVTPLLATPAAELTPSFSPDRNWLAYVSDESGTNEVYVRPFPQTASGVVRVSRTGGTEPVWAHSGRELFYRDGDGALVSATVETTPTFNVRRQQALFSAVRYRANPFGTQFDVSRDDQRFLMIRQDQPEVANETIVVMNWFEELRRLVPR